MKKLKIILTILIIILGLLILTFIISNQKSDININEYIDRNVPLKLKTEPIDLTGQNTFDIPVNSDKYEKIIDWGNKNTEGWTSTSASYVGGIYVGQNSFRMLYFPESNGVVIGFINNQGDPMQYSKTIKQGDLDFLDK